MFDKHKSGKQETPTTSSASNVTPQASAPAQPSPAAGSKTTMIGQGISISGDVSATSNLKVEGRIEGRAVESSENVEIAESGKVTASVTARTVRIAGEVTGDVAGSDKVIVSSSGRVEGNIVAPRVQLEDGALFRGSIDMSPSEPAAAEKPAAAKAVGPEKAESKAAPAAKSAAAGGGRQEPGLTLKSG